MKTRTPLVALAIGCSLALSGATSAQEAATDAAALAKAVQNPLATLVTLPLQANYNTGAGPYDRTLFNLNVQPVVPFPGEKWNVIARAILPVNSVPLGATESEFGIGDTTLTLFWSPAKAGSLTWGVGPVFGLPTASNPQVLGSEQWSLGPSAVLFYSVGRGDRDQRRALRERVAFIGSLRGHAAILYGATALLILVGLIFARLREEAEKGHKTAQAAKEGFANALSAIIDGNVTTLLTALILYNVGTGPRGKSQHRRLKHIPGTDTLLQGLGGNDLIDGDSGNDTLVGVGGVTATATGSTLRVETREGETERLDVEANALSLDIDGAAMTVGNAVEEVVAS